jgi:hypothetical protein
MPLIKASNSVIQSVYASQILPSGAVDGNVLQYKGNVSGWVPTSLDTTVKTVTTSYLLQLTDQSCVIRVNSSVNANITVPHHSLVNFKTGTQIVVIQEGAGKVTFVGATGVSVLANEQRFKTYGQWSGAVLIKLDQNVWFLGGDISDT